MSSILNSLRKLTEEVLRSINFTALGEAMIMDPTLLSQAIVVWAGWGTTSAWPIRDEARVVEAFGEELAPGLLLAIRRAEEDFYGSDARYLVEDLAQMGEVAAARFRSIRPEIDEEAIRALMWCYTYDFK